MMLRDEEQRTTLYPSIDDIPQSLDVDDIFQKIQITTATTTTCSSMVEAQHLPSSISTTTTPRRNQIRKRRGLKFQPRRSWSSITPPTTPEPLSSSTQRRKNRISNRSTHRRRHQIIANIRSVEKLTLMRHQSEPPSSQSKRNTKRVSEVLRQDISNELCRPGDELVINRATTLSGYEIGRHQAYQRQSDEVEEEDNNDNNESTMIEVLPGNYMKLRGSAEIWDAVLNDKGIECLCFGCTASLVTVQNADMVMCVSCRTISPVENGSGGGGGLGLGMKKEDAAYEKRRFESTS